MPRQNNHHFADVIFKLAFINQNQRISTQISMESLSMCSVSNKPVLVQVWCRLGDKPLTEEIMMTMFTSAYMRHSALVI